MTARKETKQPSFEASLRRLEDIVDQLERGDVPLEESLTMYEEGIRLSKICVEKLQQAELRIKKLGKDLQGNLELVDEELE